ncbi:ROK family protein [Actinokineospora sp. HUAS TT18]|uniref:ROK family protein n=1 Tax=Actinokineospora sp. HUAS TT18 TaxID=3447451 RepID=UPI003F52481A
MGIQLRGMRRSNTEAIMQAVLRQGSLSRAEIAGVTGLSAASVTKITADLVQHNVLAEYDAMATRDPGRPRVPVGMDRSRHRLAGVHIGLRWTRVGLIDLEGTVVAERIVDHRRRTPEAVTAEAHQLLDEVEAAEGRNVIGLGVSAGGWVRPDNGVLVDHPSLHWRDVNLREAMEGRGYPVFVDNSVRALGRAEWLFGAAREVGSVMFLFVGNVVGAAILSDGVVHRGRESAAGVVEHLPVGPPDGVECGCGRRDCLFSLGTDLAVVAKAQELGVVGKRANLEQVVGKARRGDEVADRLLAERAERVGEACGMLIDLMAPDLLVLGGGLLDQRQHLPNLIAAAARRAGRVPDVADRIVFSTLGDTALIRASACVALDAFAHDPLSFVG